MKIFNQNLRVRTAVPILRTKSLSFTTAFLLHLSSSHVFWYDLILPVPPEGISEFIMAQSQGQGQGPHNSNWDTDFIPFFNTGAVNSPGVSALSSNNNGHSHFTSANSNSFPAQEAHNSSSRTHQDHTLQTLFSINPVNGTNSTLEQQGKELLELLLKEVSPTAQKI